jgi:hypothetical protein
MHHRFNALKRRSAVALPVAAAALALAPAASAAPPNVCNPTTAAALQTCVSNANSSAAGTQNIIVLSAFSYTLTSPLSITNPNVSVEITGNPQQQSNPTPPTGVATVVGPIINGSGIATTQSTSPDINVAAGANLILKGVIVQNGPSAAPMVRVLGTAAIQNDALTGAGNIGLGVGGTAIVIDTTIDGSVSTGVSNTGGTLNMVNDTVTNNNAGGIAGPTTGSSTTQLVNTLITNNFGGNQCTNLTATNTTTTTSLADDSTCPGAIVDGGGGAGSGVTDANLDLNGYHGGPTVSTPICTPTQANPAFATPPSTLTNLAIECAGTPTGPAVNGGTLADCPTTDQRFFLRTSSVCDIGAYQTSATAPVSSHAGPQCVAGIPQYPAGGSATMTVQVTDQGPVGLGPDAISNQSSAFFTGPNIGMPNGTISFPVVAGTPYQAVNPAGGIFATVPFLGPYAVTDTKAETVGNVHDTLWSFTATNWFNISTNCS